MAARLLVAFLPLASAGLRSYFAKLPFNARDPPAHTTDISVGVYFEHLFKVNQKEHTFDADFWLVYKWHDGRNFSHLFFQCFIGITQKSCKLSTRLFKI